MIQPFQVVQEFVHQVHTVYTSLPEDTSTLFLRRNFQAWKASRR